MSSDLGGKTCVVTGAGSGIGRATAIDPGMFEQCLRAWVSNRTQYDLTEMLVVAFARCSRGPKA